MSKKSKKKVSLGLGSGRNAVAIVQKFFPEVNAVEDAKSDLHLEVTPKDNATAQRRSHKTCAMAVACKRKEEADGVIISLTTAYVVKGRHAVRYKLPENVSREVVSFDRNGGFEPGEYTLKAPSVFHKLGHVTGSSTNRTTNGGVNGPKHGPYHSTTNVRTALGSRMVAQ